MIPRDSMAKQNKNSFIINYFNFARKYPITQVIVRRKDPITQVIVRRKELLSILYLVLQRA